MKKIMNRIYKQLKNVQLMKKKQFYEKPSVEVVVMNQKPTLLAGSNPAPNSASFDDYENGDFSW
jgi:hypothetical protein